MNERVIHNYGKLKPSFFYLPLALLALIAFFLFTQSALNVNGYIQIQENWFYALNAKLSQFPLMQQNFTELGDTFVLLSLLTVLFLGAPKIWEALISATIVYAIFSGSLKFLFSIPRPAEALSQNTFDIVTTSSTQPVAISLETGLSIDVVDYLFKQEAKESDRIEDARNTYAGPVERARDAFRAAARVEAQKTASSDGR